MFPLRDNIPSKTFPFINYLIIILNVVVFFHEWSLVQKNMLEVFILQHGLIPAQFFKEPMPHIQNIFSSMFLHGSWGHLIGNMWFLFVFGDNVEDQLGHIKYVFYYLLMGIGAAFTQMWAHPASHLPMVGASGAIAGILGSYFVLFPKARVLTIFVIFIFIRVIEIPAFFYLGLWFFSQAINSVGTLGTGALRGEMGGVAWWAHAGGFVSGFIAIQLFKKRKW